MDNMQKRVRVLEAFLADVYGDGRAFDESGRDSIFDRESVRASRFPHR